MKNSREIILDFTSLLDVVMVILFFFILFSQFESLEARKEMEESRQAAEAVIEEYEGKMEEADGKLLEADRLLEEIGASDERKAANIEGITDFSRSTNIRLNLIMEKSSWKLGVYKGENLIADVINSEAEEMKQKICEAIASVGCTQDDTLLCEFIYNANESGTASAYRQVNKVLELIKSEYSHFYYSEIDISLGREE